ncbi:hypothetical protein NQ314_016718 [Rhamnusium bicolor]|uniref:Uncharacterized protein n=1 Tax=Rhamnusium bicolor TaxID=1586634 RepID=A0AAV8WXZ2_9CUCU|nr:hypothetical protein NQ314_016718 [Rhamnusium bicolor]
MTTSYLYDTWFISANVYDIESCTTSEYFIVNTTASHFIIRTTAEFANFDERTKKQLEPIVLQNLNCDLMCEGISQLDSGTNPGPLSSSTTVTLTVNETASLDTPVFDSASYHFNYTIESGIPRLIPLDGPITIKTNKQDSLTEAALTGGYQTYFTADLHTTTSTIDLTPNGILPTVTEPFLVLTLSVSTDSRASTGIIVYLTEFEADDTPRFSSHVYTGSYNDATSTVTLNSEITVTSTRTPAVNISGDYSDHFTVLYDDKTTYYEISVKTNLTGTEIKSLSYINLIITAAVDEKYDTAAIILSLPDPELQFTNVLYNAIYNSNDTVTVDGFTPIGFTTDVVDVPITLEGTYASNFAITYNSENNQYLIVVKTPLSADTLRKENEIVVSLIASDTYGDEAQSVVVIRLPTINTDTLIFSETVYSVEYTDNDVTSSITLDHNITIINRDNLDNITITLDSYNANFNLTYDKPGNKWVLQLKSPLSEDIILSRKDIIIIMTAEEQDNTNKGHAVLSISWTTKDAPKFTEAYYRGEYPISGTGTIELDKAINFTNVIDPANIVISLDNIVIVLTATEIGIQNRGESILILELPPNKTAPIFLNAYYLAEYPESGSGNIEFEYPIQFLNVDDPTTLTISLDSYASNFEIMYDSNKWYINIKNSLDDTILHRNIELIMTLIATEDGNGKQGESALVLKLPTATNGTAPKFSEAYYLANYPENGLDIKESLENTVLHQNAELVMTLTATEAGNDYQGESALVLKLPTARSGTAPKFSEAYYLAKYPENGASVIEFDTAISFLNVDDPTGLTINLDNYASNFEIKYDGTNGWYINIKKSLEIDILQRNAEIVATLIAKVEGSTDVGESALVMKLPTATNETAPKFSKAYYLAEYPKSGTGVIEFKSPVGFLNVENQLDLIISLDNYTNNFEITYNSNRWFINIKESLDKNILNENVELVMTLIATEPGNINTGYSALVLNLPIVTNKTAPEFEKAYYLAEYLETVTNTIEFENHIKFTNVDDPRSLVISLDDYFDNFHIFSSSDRWFINVTKPLDQSVLNKNAELVLTMTATENGNINKGHSALVMRLPPATNITTPVFSEAYYLAEYPISGSGHIEFINPIKFTNVDNPLTITISVSDYSNNFEVNYDNNIWYINIKDSLEDVILNKNAELVMTLTATSSQDRGKGYSALVLKLPLTPIGPQFAETYYLAEYPKMGTGLIEFKTPIKFLDIDDSTDLKIRLDSYTSNFEIIYYSNTWYINITQSLESSILTKNMELVMTMTATETGNDNDGKSVLILKLPTATNETSPIFEEAFYEAEYVEDETGIIEFKQAIKFLNVDDQNTLTINLDNYTNNFEIIYESNRWYIYVRTKLDENVLNRNTEIVMTMIATETDNGNSGWSALILKLPSNDGTAPKFLKAYYLADYSLSSNGIIEFESPITFLNVDDPIEVTISLDYYSDNFEIVYDIVKHRWYIFIKNNLDYNVLNKNAEIVMTMTATETGNQNEGYSALVLKLPAILNETAPEFSSAYYLADYPDAGMGNIEFYTPISFKNVVDPSKLTITLDNYNEYFEIQLDANKWYIKINNPLDDSIVNKNTELVMSLIARETGKTLEGYSALVLQLPTINTETAPKFSEALYAADYVINVNSGYISIEFNDDIVITNKEDLAEISISVDIKQISDDVLLSRTDLVVALTATDISNGLTGHSVVDLKLPPFSIETAPKFSMIYYKANYTISGATPLVTFDSPLIITNRNNLADVSIVTDSYGDNFNIMYDSVSRMWKMNVEKNLDESILNAKVDLVIALLAVDRVSGEIGEAVLVLTLPIVNNDEAPKFSSIHYSGEYKTDNGGEIHLENAIAITNKNNLSTVTISFDDSYKNNFEINYDISSTIWILNIISPLPDLILKDNTDLILTLTATETNNPYIGQSALILHLPLREVKLAPKFSLAHYTGEYVVNGNQASIVLHDTITIVNKEDLNNISVIFDSYNTNFKINYDSSKEEWTISVIEVLTDDVLNTTAELILTLIARERNNDNIGDSTLILTLPSSKNNSTEGDLMFSQIHYSADYYVEGNNGVIKVNEPITVITKLDVLNLNVSFQNDKYAEHFAILYESGNYVVSVETPLTPEILESEVSIVLTLVAAVDENKVYATLVINLPSVVKDRAIEFTQTLYDGIYKSVEGKGSFEVIGTIQVKTEEDNINIEHGFTSYTGYEEYFTISYSSNVLRVALIDDIPENVLRQQSFIPLLLTVWITGTTDSSTAVLNVEIEGNEENATPIIFSNVLYHGRYEVTDGIGDLFIDDVITVETDEVDTNVDVIITNEYESYFLMSHTNKIITVTLNKQLTPAILDSHTFIPLTLQVGIKGTSNQASAVLNIEIKYDSDPDTGSIEFAAVLYSGEYSVSAGKGNLVLIDSIQVITDGNDDDITTNISNDLGYDKYFTMSYASHTVSINLPDDLPQDVLENSFIALTLTVGIRGTTHTSSAVLNINIENNDEVTSIAFLDVLYHGRYEVTDGTGELIIDNLITVETNEADDNNVDVNVSNEYESYFTATYSNKVITVNLERQLTSGILSSNSFIPLELHVNIKGTSIRSSAVLNIQIKYDSDIDTGSIEFAEVLYAGEYSVIGGTGHLQLNKVITVITDRDDDEITISYSNDFEYNKYFTLVYSRNTVTVVVEENLPPEVLQNSFIALTLTVGIKETTHTSSAVLNIIIADNIEDKSLSFSNILYNGRYEVTDGSGVLTINDLIGVETNEADDNNIDVRISNEYQSYFTISYARNVINVTLERQLPSAILSSNSFIPLKLQVNIKGTLIQASAVLNIAIKYDSDTDSGFIEFMEVLYSGDYSVSDGTGKLDVNEVITVITDSADEEITLSISNDLGYSKHFLAIYTSNSVTVELADNLPPDALEYSFITLTLTVRIRQTTHTSSAVLNIKINDAGYDTSVVFSNVLYNGLYEITDGTGILTIKDPITIITNEPDRNLDVSISNEYASFFSVLYSSNVITVTLREQLSTEFIHSNTFIPLKLLVEIKGTPNHASAVLNIKIQSNDDDNDRDAEICPTKNCVYSDNNFIVSSDNCIGCGCFCFLLPQDKDKSYIGFCSKHNPLDERRPTGFIFKPLGEETIDATNDIDKNRRKSVAFDDNVEKMQIEPTNDEDNVSEDYIYNKPEVTHV